MADMAEWAKRNRLRMDPFSSRLLSTSIAVPPYIPGGRATTAVDEQGRIWQAPGPVVQTNHADDASNRSLGVTILASTTLKLAWKRVQWLVRCSVAGVVVTCLLWAGMESEWSRLGNLLAHTGLLAHRWGTSHRLTAKQQRGSESGFHAFGERSFVLLGVQQRPQPKLAKMWTKVWTGGPTRSSRQRPTSVTAWQPTPTTDGSRTNQNVCFAVRAA
ncbi:hypothetical protein B0T09DRAFT_395090 [Sordaria sp. MPI-SDFR-AT-0083]|nr:hypothetical protein B0T09DRAFT_395090 [Sordaria sp. MPI-SDFR-AT-0083]